jgi:hypothetical protein
MSLSACWRSSCAKVWNNPVVSSALILGVSLNCPEGRGQVLAYVVRAVVDGELDAPGRGRSLHSALHLRLPSTHGLARQVSRSSSRATGTRSRITAFATQQVLCGGSKTSLFRDPLGISMTGSGHLGDGVAVRADYLVGHHRMQPGDLVWPMTADRSGVAQRGTGELAKRAQSDD